MQQLFLRLPEVLFLKLCQTWIKPGLLFMAAFTMGDIPAFPYVILWKERTIRSVANFTRQEGEELFEIAQKVPIKTETNVFPLHEANEAFDHPRTGKVHGAAVLVM